MTCNGMSSSLFPSSFLFQMQAPNEEEDHHHQHGQRPLPNQLFPSPPPPNPQDYHGLATMLGKRSMSFPAGLDACCGGGEVNGGGGGEDDLSDDCSQAGVGERKRRLNMEQVRALEKSFELGSKLEPERKMQLARALGLQPRQIAIWFQNRRARWKTKQLEKDYDILKQQFEAVKTENESLHAQNKKLQAEVMTLRGRETTELINLNKETDQGSCSNRSENSSDINLDISTAPTTESPLDSSHQNRLFFQAARPPLAAQQFLSTTRADQIQGLKTEQGGQDDGFCNMFCGLDDQSGFWNAWPDQQNFH